MSNFHVENYAFGTILFLGILGLFGCVRGPRIRPAPLTAQDNMISEKLSLEKKRLALLKAKPLYEFSEEDVDFYLRYLQMAVPDLARRVVHLARKNIGQPYKMYLLGEFPFEIYDRDPLYRLDKSDCVTFVEHIYALALGHDWRSFFAFLQRIRYKNGEIGMATRNHDTIPDWDPQNSKWLIYDITKDLAGDGAVKMQVKTSRRKFFKKWDIAQNVKEETVKTSYIPYDLMPDIVDELKDGDFVNVIRGYGKPQWCGHVGLITVSPDGTVNFLHSCSGGVREQPILEYVMLEIALNKKRLRKPLKKDRWQFFGFKFFRLRSDPIAKLRALDGPDAPIVTGPRGLLLSRFRYPGWVEPRAELTPTDRVAAKKLGLKADYVALLKARPLFEFEAHELNDYLAYLHEVQPDLELRVRHLARKAIGEPYHLFLLGEFPFELYDDDPLFALYKSDCVVFAEHIYAMALSKSWEEFFVFLQRIRYKNGEIGILTRNHYTVAEWDTSNSWLLEDVSRKLAGKDAVPMTGITRHKSFFKKRYGIDVDMPDLSVKTYYVPSECVPDIAGKLKNGDFVNVIFGKGKNRWASHVGLISVSKDGTVNFLHSTPPRVREQPIVEYSGKLVQKNAEQKAKGKSLFYGFKFLRLRPDPLSNLRKIDGPDAPVVKGPLGVTFGAGRRWTPVMD